MYSLVPVVVVAAGCVFSEGGTFSASGDTDASAPGPDASMIDASPGSADATVTPDSAQPDDAGAQDAPVPDAALPDAALPDAAAIDAALPDASADAEPGCIGETLGFDPSNIAPCDIPDPLAKLDLDQAGAYRLNTDAGTLTSPTGTSIAIATAVVPQTDAPEILIVPVGGLHVSPLSSVVAGGERALVLVSFEDITIDGRIRAPALNENDGAGASHPDACAAGIGSDGQTLSFDSGDTAGSGGGGGAFGDDAGTGAPVADSNQAETPGGATNGDAAIVPLRGGCRGGDGGGDGGQGGGGGGAIQLVAKGLVSVAALTGRVAARGGGGRGVSGDGGGGGGGGAGGSILIEAGAIEIEGAITANGGGGGEGDRNTGFSDSGNNGRETSAFPAPGGSGLSFGGNGGAGNAATAVAQNGTEGFPNGSSAAGGGGGGGSVGRIRLRAVTSVKIGSGAVLSPVPAP